MPSVLVLAEAKTYLNISVTTHDAELQAVIDSAEAVLAEHVGPLQPTPVTARVFGGGTAALMLPVAPAISLTTVTPYLSTALTIADLHLDLESAVVTFNNGLSFVAAYYDIEYAAGRATCPDDLLLANKELVRHMWQASKRGGGGKPGTAPSDAASNTLPGAAYLLPFRVAELIAPHLDTGFA